MAFKDRLALIKGINTPLSFFVLALLIAESFIGLVIVYGDIEKSSRTPLIYFGGALFIIVTFFVFWLILKNKVRDLTFDKEAHLLSEKRRPDGSA